MSSKFRASRFDQRSRVSCEMALAVNLFELRSTCRNRGQLLPAMALIAAALSLLLQRCKRCKTGQWPAANLLMVELFSPHSHKVSLLRADQGVLILLWL